MKESYRGCSAKRQSRFASSQGKELTSAEQQSLLDQALVGSNEAHGLLIESCRPWMHCIIRRGLPDRRRRNNDADDLAQEACLKAHEGFADFLGPCITQYRAWLRTICQNLLAAALRKQSGTRQEQPLDDVSLDAELHRGGRRQARPDEIVGLFDDLARLTKALNRLPRDERLIVVWRHFDELTYIEIAARLRWTRHAVERAFRRAFGRLRRILTSLAATPALVAAGA